MLARIATFRKMLEANEHIDSITGFIADVGRLLLAVAKDPRVPRSAKVLAIAAGAYAVSPLDVIPDIPVIGQLDDLWVVSRALRHLIRSAGYDVVHELWQGDDESFIALLVLAGVDE